MLSLYQHHSVGSLLIIRMSGLKGDIARVVDEYDVPGKSDYLLEGRLHFLFAFKKMLV